MRLRYFVHFVSPDGSKRCCPPVYTLEAANIKAFAMMQGGFIHVCIERHVEIEHHDILCINCLVFTPIVRELQPWED